MISTKTVRKAKIKFALNLVNFEKLVLVKEEFEGVFLIESVRSLTETSSINHYLFRIPSHHKDVDWKLNHIPLIIKYVQRNSDGNLNFNHWDLSNCIDDNSAKIDGYTRVSLNIISISTLDQGITYFDEFIINQNDDRFIMVFPSEFYDDSSIKIGQKLEDDLVILSKDIDLFLIYMRKKALWVLDSKKKKDGSFFEAYPCTFENYKNAVVDIEKNIGDSVIIFYDPERNLDVQHFLTDIRTNIKKCVEDNPSNRFLAKNDKDRSKYDPNEKYLKFHREYISNEGTRGVAIISKSLAKNYIIPYEKSLLKYRDI